MTIARCMWLAYWSIAVSVTPTLGTEAGSVEAAATSGFGHAVFRAVYETAVFTTESGITNTSTVSVARSVTGTVIRA